MKQLDSNPAVMQEFVLALSKNARRSIAIKATAAEVAEGEQVGSSRKVVHTPHPPRVTPQPTVRDLLPCNALRPLRR